MTDINESALIGSQAIPKYLTPNSDVANKKISTSTELNPAMVETSSNIKISGQALMLSRLFRAGSENSIIPVETNTTDSAITGSKSIYYWLTNEDRATLAEAYGYANSKGVDLRYVDDLASDMAIFRQSKSVTYGDIYDLEGHKLSFDFSSTDKAVADRLLSSGALNNTKIDSGFLGWVLDSSKPTHAVDFSFLEKMVNVLDNNGGITNSNQTYSLAEFDSYQAKKNEFVTHVSSEVNTSFSEFKPDYVSINGVGRWLTDNKSSNTQSNIIAHRNYDQLQTLIRHLFDNDK